MRKWLLSAAWLPPGLTGTIEAWWRHTLKEASGWLMSIMSIGLTVNRALSVLFHAFDNVTEVGLPSP